MNASIISRVSQIIIENKNDIKVPKPNKHTGTDSIQISSAGNDAMQIASAIEKDTNEDRTFKIDRIKENITQNNYQISESMIDDIAEKIAAIFV